MASTEGTKKKVSLMIAAATFILIAVNMVFYSVEENEKRVDEEVASLGRSNGCIRGAANNR